jgi:hypothetical protein
MTKLYQHGLSFRRFAERRITALVAGPPSRLGGRRYHLDALLFVLVFVWMPSAAFAGSGTWTALVQGVPERGARLRIRANRRAIIIGGAGDNTEPERADHTRAVFG